MNEVMLHGFDTNVIWRRIILNEDYKHNIQVENKEVCITNSVISFLQLKNVKMRIGSKYFNNSMLNIHYGIIPEYKTYELYKRLFFEYDKHFVGISGNIFMDWNQTKTKWKNVVMLSIGSWNHQYRRYFKIKKNIYIDYFKFMNITYTPYRIQHESRKIVIFVQNYSPYEYWFGWSCHDINIWLEREKKFIKDIKRYTNKDLHIKFHPKMEDKYIDYFKNNIDIQDIYYYDKIYDLTRMSEEIYCAIVNSGTTAIHLCILGVPMFYIDDTYSNIPMSYYASSNVSKITDFDISELPNQQDAFDFICSQIFKEDEFVIKIYELIENGLVER